MNIYTYRGKCLDCKIHIAIMPANDKEMHINLTHNHSKVFNHRCAVYREQMHLKNGHLEFGNDAPVAVAVFPS